MTLLSRIRQLAANPPKRETRGGATEQAAKKLETLATGKESQSLGTGQTNIQEQIAGLQEDVQQQQIQQGIQQQAEQAGLAEQQAQLEEKADKQRLELNLKQLQQQQTMTISNILDKVQQSDRDLDSREDALQLEIAGTLLNVQDKKLQEEIRRAGIRQGLQDKAMQNKIIMQVEIGENKTRLLQELGFQVEDAARWREFKELNGIEDLETANKIAQAAIDDEAEARKIGVFADTAKAGIDAYEGGSKAKPAPAAPETPDYSTSRNRMPLSTTAPSTLNSNTNSSVRTRYK